MFNRDFAYIYVGMSVCRYVGMSVCLSYVSRRNYVAHAHAQSRFWAVKTVTPVLFRLCARAALAWTKKKRSLRNET